jgi:hypothetical protein
LLLLGRGRLEQRLGLVDRAFGDLDITGLG